MIITDRGYRIITNDDDDVMDDPQTKVDDIDTNVGDDDVLQPTGRLLVLPYLLAS